MYFYIGQQSYGNLSLHKKYFTPYGIMDLIYSDNILS